MPSYVTNAFINMTRTVLSETFKNALCLMVCVFVFLNIVTFLRRRVGRSPYNSHPETIRSMCVASIALATERSSSRSALQRRDKTSQDIKRRISNQKRNQRHNITRQWKTHIKSKTNQKRRIYDYSLNRGRPPYPTTSCQVLSRL